MADAGKTRISIFNKIKTKINSSASDPNLPELTGMMLQNRILVGQKMNTDSGEALLYYASDTHDADRECIVKLYRRRNSVKHGVLEKLSSLNSPNVARIICCGEIDGYAYTVMPYYRGDSLDAFVRNGGTFSLEDLKSAIIPSLLESLKSIHEIGIIHKDLKPANIIVNEEDQNLVLIDFGISTETDGRTIVVTQTGKTPFYAAPETVSGAFSIYSDYYSLGICIYELYTGYTPFQNSSISESDIARYAQIQQIPYPDNFPDELRDLIDGLTYKDLSNRSDPDNPNRRWSYREVSKWLRGEKQPVPGSGLRAVSAVKGDFEIPYFVDGKKFYTNRELAEYFLINWQKGIRELGRGFLTRHYEQNGDNSRLKLCEKYEKELSGSKTDGITQLYSLLYSLSSGNTAVYWKNYHFDSLNSYGKAVIAAVIHNKDQELIKSVGPMLSENVLKIYAETQLSGILANDKFSALLLVLILNVKLISSDPLDENGQALRFGNSITGEENFKIGSYIYESTADFRNRLTGVYKSDLEAFMKYFSENEAEIERQGRLFTGESKATYDAVLSLRDKVIVLPSGDVFRNHADILQYQKKLWDENKLQLFSGFYSCNRDYLKSHTAEFKYADPKLFGKITSFTRNMFYIDEHYFRDVDEFVEYVRVLIECQVKYNINSYDNFFDLHRKNINKVSSVRDDIRNALEKIKQIYDSLSEYRNAWKQNHSISGNKVTDEHVEELSVELPKEFKNGQVIKFGRYFKNNNNKKEPLEWRVLHTDGKTALLITENAIDCMQYHQNFIGISWNVCDLRKWCNDDFLKEAFSETERNIIVTTINRNNYGPETNDLVFCLSTEEAEKYFESDRDRICKVTSYAQKNGAYDDGNGCTTWWLRSSGSDYGNASIVDGGGYIYCIGVNVHFDVVTVRLACRINLELLS